MAGSSIGTTPSNSKPRYYASVAWFDTHIYFGLWKDIKSTISAWRAGNTAGDYFCKGFDKLADAAKFCHDKSRENGPECGDKHIEIHDLITGEETNYRDKKTGDYHQPKKTRKLQLAYTEKKFLAALKADPQCCYATDAAGNTAATIAAERGFIKPFTHKKYGYAFMKGFYETNPITGKHILHVAAARQQHGFIKFAMSQATKLDVLARDKSGKNVMDHLIPHYALASASARAKQAATSLLLLKDERYGVRVILNYIADFGTYEIVNVQVQGSELRRYDDYNLKQRYPEAFDNFNRIKPGYQRRHVKAFALLVDEERKKYIGKLPQEIIKAKVFNLRELTIQIADELKTKLNADKNNVFLGAEDENLALGWLFTELRKMQASGYNTDRLDIPREHQALIKRHSHFKDLGCVHWKYINVTSSNFNKLLELSGFDDPKKAKLKPYKAKPKTARRRRSRADTETATPFASLLKKQRKPTASASSSSGH